MKGEGLDIGDSFEERRFTVRFDENILFRRVECNVTMWPRAVSARASSRALVRRKLHALTFLAIYLQSDIRLTTSYHETNNMSFNNHENYTNAHNKKPANHSNPSGLSNSNSRRPFDSLTGT